MTAITELYEDIQKSATERNGEVFDLISHKLEVACRYVYNLYQYKKIEKLIKKFPPF